MSLNDVIRGLIDPLHPAVREWLERELPRLVQDGYLLPAQADTIARRYGVRVEATAVSAVSPAGQPAAAAARTAGAAPFAPPGGATTPAAIPDGGVPPHGPTAVGGLPTPAAGPRPATSPFLADHAFSIVLYLGAFLVVAAVVIFLAYSWGDVSAGGKLAVLVLLTLGFLGAAGLCLPRPSVRPAGRTFLALGAILVPANVAAVYFVYFEAGPIPGAVFWLLGAVVSGALHAALSLRLSSKGYGVLATLSVPVAAAALGWLIASQQAPRDPEWAIGPSAAIGLVLALAAARSRPPIPLVQSTRVVAALLLPLAYFIALPFLGEDDLGQYGAPAALLLMAGGLAWEAMRGGKTWWIGAMTLLIAALPNAIALAVAEDRPLFASAVVRSARTSVA
jgi:hypothetical protein